MHQGALGDLMLSLPALQTIRRACPGRAVELLGYPAVLSLISRDGTASVASADSAGVSTLYGDFADVAPRMRQYLAGFERIFLFSAAAGSACIDNARRCNPAAVHVRTFPDTACHVVDYQLARLAALGLAPADTVPRLPVSDRDRGRAADYLSAAADTSTCPCIAVHPGSGGRHKCWPPEKLAAVMKHLHGETGAGFFVVRGPADGEASDSLLDRITGLPHRVLAGLDLPLLAALLAKCALYIGNDSGITHMAAALGVPAVAVFGPTDPAVWGPRGRDVRIVRCTGHDGQWQWPGPQQVFTAARELLPVDK